MTLHLLEFDRWSVWAALTLGGSLSVYLSDCHASCCHLRMKTFKGRCCRRELNWPGGGGVAPAAFGCKARTCLVVKGS